MRTRPAARIFLALAAFVIAFQLALALGAPWGELTMGGANPGRLPPAMRAAAFASAALIAVSGAIVAARAGLMLPRWHRRSRRLVWVVVAYLVVAAVLNAITPSARERALWLPVVLVMLGCAVVVARSRDPVGG